MPVLSKRLLTEVTRDVQKATGIRPFFMDLQGNILGPDDPLESPPAKVRKLRLVALHESITTGQPYLFETVPGLMSWLIALENRRIIHGAIVGGDVFSTESEISSADHLQDLAAMGIPKATAHRYLASRPVFSPATMRQASRYTQEVFYQMSGWKPVQMEENRIRTEQQRQIAEAVEDQRRRGSVSTYPFEKERALLSHIRAGDQAGARRVLNEMLGAMYLTSPKLVVLRARAIEMMGYLTRTAVEDSPVMESLIIRNHHWMEQLIRARDFEELSRVLTEALNDFIEGIYLHGFNRSNSQVSLALEFISRNFASPLSLADVAKVAGLSSYRLAHVVKAHTGKTVLQLILHARIQSARQLLEDTSKPCTEIAYVVGFNDQSYFIRHFKRIIGETPARYRRARQSGTIRSPIPAETG